MKKIICTSSVYSVGCTFVDWSIHFLSGQSVFYSIKDQNWIPVVSDPISKINAHGHKKNHPSGLDSTKQYVNHFQNNESGQLFSFYPCMLFADIACKSLGLEIPQLLDQDLTKKIQIKQTQDWGDTLNYCLEQNLKVIYIELNQKSFVYTKSTRSLERMFFESRMASCAQETTTHVDDLFFQNAHKVWQQQGLVNIWDQREFLALCRRPFDNCYMDCAFDYTSPHLWVDSQSLWYNGQHAMEKIMDFCELTIDKKRWKPWFAVYNKWQHLQFKILEFTFNYQHIIDAIVNNWYYKIDELTFEQEIIIQHCLIYQHGLNLKTWGLKKFPSNTKELHQLLEPNIHAVESIY